MQPVIGFYFSGCKPHIAVMGLVTGGAFRHYEYAKLNTVVYFFNIQMSFLYQNSIFVASNWCLDTREAISHSGIA